MPRAIRTLAKQPAPAGIYESSYDVRLGMHICARIAAGESLASLCRNDASMPTEKTVWNWSRSHPEFAVMKAQALGAARTRALESQAARDAAKRAAASRTGRRAWNKGRSGYSPERAEQILDRLQSGEALTEICRDPAMPCVATVYNWLRAEPDFVAEYRLAREVQMEVVVVDAVEGTSWKGSYGASMRDVARAARAAFRRCGRLWPRRYAAPGWVASWSRGSPW